MKIDTRELGISTKTGVEWTITPTTFWTNSISYRKNSGKDEDLLMTNQIVNKISFLTATV
jgi:hypothetical protein